jgi:hypothetical protein
MCNLPSVRHTRAARTDQEPNGIHAEERDGLSASAPGMLTQSECVSGEEKLRGRKNPGRSGKPCSPISVRRSIAFDASVRRSGQGTRGIGSAPDPPLSGAAKSGAHVPVYRCRRCVRRTERSTAASSRLDRGERTTPRLRGAGRAGAGCDCGHTPHPPGVAQEAPGTAHAGVPGLADIKPELASACGPTQGRRESHCARPSS